MELRLCDIVTSAGGWWFNGLILHFVKHKYKPQFLTGRLLQCKCLKKENKCSLVTKQQNDLHQLKHYNLSNLYTTKQLKDISDFLRNNSEFKMMCDPVTRCCFTRVCVVCVTSVPAVICGSCPATSPLQEKALSPTYTSR